MQLHINGKLETTSATTLSELVAERELSADALVIEHNRNIIRQESWATTSISEGDELELLSFVGGG